MVPAGWEYEVYQGEQLVGVGTRDAPEPVAAQLGYGATPVRIRMLGPAGQERTEELTFLVPAAAGARRASGATARAAAPAATPTPCDAFGYGDVRYGVSRSLTVGLGGEHTARDSGSAATRPYGMLSYGLRPDLRMEVRARAGALVARHPLPLRPATAAGGSPAVGSGRRSWPRIAEPVWFGEGAAALRGPFPGAGATLIVQGRARQRPDGTRRPAWQTGRDLRVTAGVQLALAYESGFQPVDVATVMAHTFLPRHLLRRLRDVNVNARVDYGGVRSCRTRRWASPFAPAQWASMSMAGGWQGSTARAVARADLHHPRSPAAYFQANAFARRGGTGVFVTAGGGVAWGRTGRRPARSRRWARGA